jgi:hypothetical protein
MGKCLTVWVFSKEFPGVYSPEGDVKVDISSFEFSCKLTHNMSKPEADMAAEGKLEEAVYFEKDEAVVLSPEHRDYLIQRHGTIELDPMPTSSEADPYNWPQWKVPDAAY